MKQYNPPKEVLVMLSNGTETQVQLIKYDDTGIVFYDKEYAEGTKKVFVPYSSLECVMEV